MMRLIMIGGVWNLNHLHQHKYLQIKNKKVKSSAGAPREKAIRDASKKMLKEYKYNIEVFDKEKN